MSKNSPSFCSGTGITLVALTITIIIILILAGITLSIAIGEEGFIGKAEQSQLTEIIEKYRTQIDAVHVNWALDKTLNDNITIDDFWKRLENKKVIEDWTTDVKPIDEDNGLYEITTVDKYVFEVYIDSTKTETTYVGKENKLLPVIRKIEVTNKTTNRIDIQVRGSRLESGTISYYYKKTSEENYTELKTNTTELTASYTELAQTTTYDIKVVATNQNGSNELVIQETTGTVGGATSGLREGNIIASTPTWSNGTASITLSTNTGLTIQWQKGGISGTWTTGTEVTGINHNETIFARLTDGTNYGDEASVTVLDGNNPQTATISLGATTANTGVNVTATVTHNDNESGPNITSCKWVYNTTSGTIGTNPSSYTGTFSSNGQSIIEVPIPPICRSL